MKRRSAYADKSVIITGGASGLGLELAKQLLNHGASVAILDVDEAALERLSSGLRQENSRLLLLGCDVTDLYSLGNAVNTAHETFGPLHYFFNNAGIGGTLPFTDATPEHWKRILDLNLMGVIHGTTLAFGLMKTQGYGHIINISSIAGLLPIPGQALYNTTKYAVVGLTQSLQPELRAYGIQLSVVCPGAIATSIFYKPIIGKAAEPDPKRIPKEAIEAELAAAEILIAVAKGKELIVLPFRDRMAYWIYRVAPQLLAHTSRQISESRRAQDTSQSR